jgi:hypothetical protein
LIVNPDRVDDFGDAFRAISHREAVRFGDFRLPQRTSLLIDSIFSTEINEFVKQGESGKPNYRPRILLV